MKILLVSVGHYHDEPGGAQKIVLDEAVALRRRGNEVWVLAHGDSLQPEYEQKDEINILRYSTGRVAHLNPARWFAHQKAATAVLARNLTKVDAIHGHIQLAYYAATQYYGDAVHSSFTVHSPAKLEMAIAWSNSSILRRLAAPVGLQMINHIEKECLRRSHVVTALSQYTIDCIGRIHGREYADKVRLIPGWVDTSRFVPVEDREHIKVILGWPTDLPILFTLRRLVPRMGLDRLLDACHRLLQEGHKFHLIIGGNGPLRGRLEEHTKTHGLSNAVTFMGRVADRELPLAYAACDTFVLPTTELECFGLIALEALSSGRSVLATPVGAIPEIIRKIDSSWLARSAETEDIAELLRQYLTGMLPAHTPSQLHEDIYRDYDSERVLDKFVDLISGNLA
jgi:glycosyltransferase involved in cell wall biosynthesis